MGEFMIREWDVILPGWRWLCEPRVVVSTPCGAASTRGTTVFVPSLFELKMNGRIHDGRDLIVPGWCWLHEPQVVFSTTCGVVSTRGTTLFVPVLLDLDMYGRIYDPVMAPYLPRVALALRTPGWRFHAVGVGIDPRTIVFVPGLLE